MSNSQAVKDFIISFSLQSGGFPPVSEIKDHFQISGYELKQILRSLVDEKFLILDYNRYKLGVDPAEYGKGVQEYVSRVRQLPSPDQVDQVKPAKVKQPAGGSLDKGFLTVIKSLSSPVFFLIGAAMSVLSIWVQHEFWLLFTSSLVWAYFIATIIVLLNAINGARVIHGYQMTRKLSFMTVLFVITMLILITGSLQGAFTLVQRNQLQKASVAAGYTDSADLRKSLESDLRLLDRDLEQQYRDRSLAEKGSDAYRSADLEYRRLKLKRQKVSDEIKALIRSGKSSQATEAGNVFEYVFGQNARWMMGLLLLITVVFLDLSAPLIFSLAIVSK